MSSHFSQLRSANAHYSAGDTTNPDDVDRILAADSNRSGDRNWPRLDNTERVAFLREFAEVHGKENGFGDEAIVALQSLLEDAIRKKKLLRVKEVVFDKAEQRITAIPGLEFDAESMIGRIVRCKAKKSEKN